MQYLSILRSKKDVSIERFFFPLLKEAICIGQEAFSPGIFPFPAFKLLLFAPCQESYEYRELFYAKD